MKTFTRPALSLFVCLLIICGCSDKPSERITLNDAHQKFKRLCKDEYNLDVTLTPLKNTVWIYLPIEDELFGIKADENGPLLGRDPKESYSINFLETEFIENSFHINFDITKSRKYLKSLGYGSSSKEEFAKKFRSIYEAILRSYFSVKEAPEDYSEKNYVRSDQAPDFFVIAMADIKNGIETKQILYLDDYKKYASQAIPYEEYQRRTVSDTYGDKSIIGDTEGKHLNYVEITMDYFLAKQIDTRINYNIVNGFTPLDANLNEELLGIVAATTKFYDFEDFYSVVLNDLTKEGIEDVEIVKDGLSEFAKEESKGKYHVINFR